MLKFISLGRRVEMADFDYHVKVPWFFAYTDF